MFKSFWKVIDAIENKLGSLPDFYFDNEEDDALNVALDNGYEVRLKAAEDSHLWLSREPSLFHLSLHDKGAPKMDFGFDILSSIPVDAVVDTVHCIDSLDYGMHEILYLRSFFMKHSKNVVRYYRVGCIELMVALPNGIYLTISNNTHALDHYNVFVNLMPKKHELTSVPVKITTGSEILELATDKFKEVIGEIASIEKD